MLQRKTNQLYEKKKPHTNINKKNKNNDLIIMHLVHNVINVDHHRQKNMDDLQHLSYQQIWQQ
jgi:hypothetical protein